MSRIAKVSAKDGEHPRPRVGPKGEGSAQGCLIIRSKTSLAPRLAFFLYLPFSSFPHQIAHRGGYQMGKSLCSVEHLLANHDVSQMDVRTRFNETTII